MRWFAAEWSTIDGDCTAGQELWAADARTNRIGPWVRSDGRSVVVRGVLYSGVFQGLNRDIFEMEGNAYDAGFLGGRGLTLTKPRLTLTYYITS